MNFAHNSTPNSNTYNTNNNLTEQQQQTVKINNKKKVILVIIQIQLKKTFFSN